MPGWRGDKIVHLFTRFATDARMFDERETSAVGQLWPEMSKFVQIYSENLL